MACSMNLPDLLPLKALLRPDEVAEAFHISRRTVYRMIRDGRMPAVRLGNLQNTGPWRIPRDELIQTINYYQANPPAIIYRSRGKASYPPL